MLDRAVVLGLGLLALGISALPADKFTPLQPSPIQPSPLSNALDLKDAKMASDCPKDSVNHFGLAKAQKENSAIQEGRICEAAFMAYFEGTAYGKSAIANHGYLYSAYLGTVFNTALDMMPGSSYRTIGEHCFKAVEKLPFAFYKDKDGKGGYCH